MLILTRQDILDYFKAKLNEKKNYKTIDPQ